MFSELVEARKALQAKQDVLAQAYKEGGYKVEPGKGSTIDPSKINCLGEGLSNVQKAEKLTEMLKELDDLGATVDQLAVFEQAEAALRRKANTTGLQHPSPELEQQEREEKKEAKSIGQQFCESAEFKAYNPHSNGPSATFKANLKTLLSTTAGWAPQVTLTDRFVEKAERPIQFSDILPTENTNQSAVSYMEETTFTNNAAEVAEGGEKPEAALAFTRRTVPVETVAVWIPVTEQQLEDVPRIEALINNRLTFMLMQRLDTQAAIGTGVTPQLQGVLTLPTIQTQAKGADPTPDAIRKAMTKVRVTGQAVPNAVVLHPNDWEDIRLLRTVDGIYIWGSPAEAGPERIWGVRVVEAQGITENTGVTGDFANFSAKVMRHDVDIQVGFINDDFKFNRKSIRAEMRLALVWYRPTAFCSITGI